MSGFVWPGLTPRPHESEYNFCTVQRIYHFMFQVSWFLVLPVVDRSLVKTCIQKERLKRQSLRGNTCLTRSQGNSYAVVTKGTTGKWCRCKSRGLFIIFVGVNDFQHLKHSTCHFQDLSSASDSLKQIFPAARPNYQKHFLDLGSDTSSEWNLCAGSSDVSSRWNQLWRREMSINLQVALEHRLWTSTSILNSKLVFYFPSLETPPFSGLQMTMCSWSGDCWTCTRHHWTNNG